jgi:hypothetical protein
VSKIIVRNLCLTNKEESNETKIHFAIKYYYTLSFNFINGMFLYLFSFKFFYSHTYAELHPSKPKAFFSIKAFHTKLMLNC